MKFQTVVKQANGVLIKCCCLNKIIPRLEKAEIYSVFIVDYGPVPTARNVAIQSYTVTNTFQRNFYGIKHA
jgi:hypothetical protein